ncbi:YciI family protein [Kribbella sp. NPDC048915]|uniref:YciI family protein n=1 Tax=Kribbella sp. NPDC048915 TaxID=3155148 RepID=UPI0033FB5C4F
MEYFVYGRDAARGFELKVALNEEHWTFMDGYADQLIARGPTLTEDRERTTGSLHIVDLPDEDAVRSFAYDEPYYRAGAFETVEIKRFNNRFPGRTMWDFTGSAPDRSRYLVLTRDESRRLTSPHLIMYGDLLDGEVQIGRAALVEAPSPTDAAALIEADHAEVHPWEFGGRR